MRRRKRRLAVYTKGEVNKLVDDIFHPLGRQHWMFRILDEASHALVEGDAKVSVVKFVRYSLPEIVKWLISGSDKDEENK